MTIETTRSIYRVSVDCANCTKGPHRISVLVIASTPDEALDRATEHPNASKLYDEEIQRAIVNGEISESRVERKYSGYIEEATYVGELDRDKRQEQAIGEFKEAMERMSE